MSPFAKRLLVVLVGILALVAAALLLVRTLVPAAAPVVTTDAPAAGGLPSSGIVDVPAAATGGILENVNLAPARVTVGAVADAQQVLEQKLLVTARDFAERYGSYSSDGRFSNLETLLPLMTDAFRASTETAIAKGASSASATFVGVTTKTLAVKPAGTVSADAAATVAARTQRTTVTGTAAPVVTYETLTMRFRYQGGVWMADSAVWSTP